MLYLFVNTTSSLDDEGTVLGMLKFDIIIYIILVRLFKLTNCIDLYKKKLYSIGKMMKSVTTKKLPTKYP